MTDLCFAKPIDGGYKIVSLDRDTYHLATLPESCFETGRRVVLAPDLADRIIKIKERADQHIGLTANEFMMKVEKLRESIPGSRPETTELQDEAFSRMLALYQLWLWLVSFTTKKADDYEDMLRYLSRNLAKLSKGRLEELGVVSFTA